MTSNYEQEIIDLHAFFQGWFRGELEKTETVFNRVAGTMGPNFCLITPQGVQMERDFLLRSIRNAHGSNPASRIWIKNARVRYEQGEVLLACYEEWQQLQSGPKGRLSTVLFQQSADMPNGLLWLHVHETWLPETTTGS